MSNKNINVKISPQFTEADARENINSGDNIKTIFGKLRKWLSDLKPVAFSGSYNDLDNKPTIPAAVAVKGNAESTYRTGNVNLTPANIGAARASHTQASSTINAMTGYTKPSSTSAITTSDTLNQAIGKLEKGLEDISGSDVTSWIQLRDKVRNNDMSDINISDQYSCNKGETTIDFDVIGKNQDTPTSSLYTNTLTLRTHFQLPIYNGMQFDAPEAFYYCSSSLSAGTYYVSSMNTLNYQFTLTQPVPAGGQLVFVNGSTSQVASYSSAYSRTAIEIETVTKSSEETEGTNLGTLQNDAKSGNLNTYNRARNGNNNWKESAIRQWVNSNKLKGEWWQPQNNWDRPPEYADTMNGFLYDLDPEFLEVVGLTSKITVRSRADGGGTDTTEDLFFLLSQTEVYGGQAVTGIDEGQAYTFYSENSSLSAPGTGADTNRITYRNSVKQDYWLRTPHPTISDRVNLVSSYNGSIYNNYPSNYFWAGVVLACNII